MTAKAKRKRKRGDPDVLDRLKRATGAYLARTGKAVEWKDLAKAAGIGLSTMTDITTLNRKVQIADAVAFADYLGVEFAWLAAGRGPMTATKELPPEARQVSDASTSTYLPEPTAKPARRAKGDRSR